MTDPNLTSRYEIRRLSPEHIEWVKAISAHCTIFCSSVWPVVYPDHKEQRCYQFFNDVSYLVEHQINSGMSFGVFDKQYVYKHPESASVGGALYWDEDDLEHHDVDGHFLLREMDFPLVAFALSCDGAQPLDPERLRPLCDQMPLIETVSSNLESHIAPNAKEWQPIGPKDILMRAGTCTRQDYAGQGLMTMLSRFVMREAAAEGYRAIQIKTTSDAVEKAWFYPPEPFRALLVSEFSAETCEEIHPSGRPFKPFYPSKQRFAQIVVDLKTDDSTPPALVSSVGAPL
ncbi:hypothetical protein M501DRAFT_1013420 [Patellaria atrata CBS 101060]|uniref:Uncharacterized protein n=1 Tax=Patellaria atrata CBS 101060 TaxID=1346257 RepID=A0A9P4VUJ9_9PEZI|nr:hypothetical protein M501DRAFT_1013420 [Patellaria atrata CBS 101060]